MAIEPVDGFLCDALSMFDARIGAFLKDLRTQPLSDMDARFLPERPTPGVF